MQEAEERLVSVLSGADKRLEELCGIPVLGVIPQGPGKRHWLRRRKNTVDEK